MGILSFFRKGLQMRSADSRGFTLVEVLVSLSCMVIAFAFLFRLHLASTVANSQNDLELRALSKCSEALESQRAKTFSGIVVGNNVNTAEKPFTVTTVVTQPYFWQKSIRVTVNWNQTTGSSVHKVVSRSMSLSSVVVRYN
jgi:prepilin-type N-terminal cleavage/methylation domain-containing protein